MNAWLLRAPWWKLAVVMGLLAAPVFVLMFRQAGDREWTEAVLMGLGVAVFCGPVLGLVLAYGLRDSMAAVEELPEHDQVVVERAARRGAVPEDHGQPKAALRLGEDRLVVLRATRTRGLTFSAVLVLVTGFLAVARSPWWWIAVVASVALIVLVLIAPARLARRAELLRRAGA